MHGTCMCVFSSLDVNRMGFSKCDSGFILAFPFPDNHGVMEFFHLVEIWIVGWFWNWVRWSQENSQGPRNPLTGFCGIVVKIEGGDMKILQGFSEEILRHPSLF